MQIDNEFTVRVPVERAWEVLTDLEGIAPCMPGAQLTGHDGDVYRGRVKIKVGPVVSEYAGTATFVEKDDATHRAVISASGRDSRGAGNASAEIVAQLRPDGDRTVVTVNTDLRITGKIAQLGRGMIKEVSTKLLGQFVDCLEGKLGASPAGEAATAGPEMTAGAAATAAPSTPAAAPSTPAAAPSTRAAVPSTPVEPAETPSTAPPATAATSPGSASDGRTADPEPLDVMGVAGGSIAKRVVPLVLVLIALVGLVIYLAAR